MTLQEHFEDYLRAVYPEQPNRFSVQYQQLRGAFFGGCLVGYTSTEDFTDELHRHPKEMRAKLAAHRAHVH